MFGHWATILLRQPVLETPQSFVDALKRAFPDTDFYIVSHVRLWGDWVESILVTMSGMGGSVGAAHSFVWVRRHDYPVSTFGEPANAFDEPAHPGDVIMIPRKYMASTAVCQQPIVAMPYSRLNLLRAQSHPYPKFAPRLKYSVDQKKKLMSTAAKLEQFPFFLNQAAAYLKSLCTRDDAFWSPPPSQVSVPTADQHSPSSHWQHPTSEHWA